MLEEIGTVEAVPDFLEQVKQRNKKLMGFGHRVYKNYDPRAKIIREVAYEVSMPPSSPRVCRAEDARKKGDGSSAAMHGHLSPPPLGV